MKYTPRTIGFLQAAGLSLYVGLFGFMASSFTNWLRMNDIEPRPTVGITVFLLAFIISATICSLLMFGYPTMLFSDSRKSEAAQTIFWCVGWLILIHSGLIFGVMYIRL